MDIEREGFILRANSMANATKNQTETPSALGFSMPAEWERHEATWLGWPHNPADWPDKLDTIRWVYGEMVRKISPGERVRLLVGNRTEQRMASRFLELAGCDVRRVEFVVHANQPRLDAG